MKTIIINASPKAKNSNTENFLKHLISKLPEKETEIYKLNEIKTTEILNCDSLVFTFPLYIDSLPSELLSFLSLLEKADLDKNIMVFAVANNGFFEGTQNHIAFDIIKNWCVRAGVKWGQGIGIGAGEMSPVIANTPLKKSPFASLDTAFDSMALNIEKHNSAENVFISPKFPRLFWKFAGTYTFWLPKARKNGLKGKDIFSKS